jgi:hypothetical protein
MPATIEVKIHDYEVGAEKTVTVTLSDEQIDECVKQKQRARTEETKTEPKKK